MHTVGDLGGVHRIQLLSIGPNNMGMHYYVISDIEGKQAYIITFSVGEMVCVCGWGCGCVWGVWVCVDWCMGGVCVCVWVMGVCGWGVCVCVF